MTTHSHSEVGFCAQPHPPFLRIDLSQLCRPAIRLWSWVLIDAPRFCREIPTPRSSDLLSPHLNTPYVSCVDHPFCAFPTPGPRPGVRGFAALLHLASVYTRALLPLATLPTPTSRDMRLCSHIYCNAACRYAENTCWRRAACGARCARAVLPCSAFCLSPLLPAWRNACSQSAVDRNH